VKSLYPLANKVGSLTTEAVEAGAHGFGVIRAGLGHRNATAIKTKGFVSYPSALTTGWCNPDPGSSSSMDNGQSPLGLKLQDIGVGNQFRSDWVHDLQPIWAKDQLGSDPDQIGNYRQKPAEQQIEKSLRSTCRHNNAIGREEKNENECSPSPSKVASRSKGFSHHPIIAGETL